MKKFMVIIALLAIPAISMAASKEDSGNRELNRYLERLSFDVYEGKVSNATLNRHIQQSFKVNGSEFKLMARRKLDPGERYLVGLIHKSTKAPVSKIVNRYRGKRAWRDVIYYCGATPEWLNELRKGDEKSWRKEAKKANKLAKAPKCDCSCSH